MANSSSNVGQVVRLWASLALSFGIVAAASIHFAHEDGWVPMLMFGGIMAASLTAVFAIRRTALRGFARDFLSPGPEALIARSQRTLGRARGPYVRHMLALGMASSRA